MPLRCSFASAQTYRLQVSLVVTRRVEGKVRPEHVASPGLVPVPPSIAYRVAFWA
jgi:hypothetical protein